MLDRISQLEAQFIGAQTTRRTTAVQAAARINRTIEAQRALNRALITSRLGRSVLVVEDDDELRVHLAGRIGKELDVQAYHAPDSASAQAIQAAQRCAVVVADYDLGAGQPTGLDLLRAIGRGPRAVLYSGIANDEALAEAARLIDATVIPKGDLGAIVVAVRSLLAEAAPLDASVALLRKTLDTAREPMTLLRCVRSLDGTLVDVEWVHVNPEALCVTKARAGMRLSSVAPGFISSQFWAIFSRAADERVPHDGDVEWAGRHWRMRLTALGHDLLLMSAVEVTA